MIDLDRTMFFKARFEIEAPQGEDVLWSLVLSVRDWSLRKARRDGYSLPQEMRFWSKLKSGEMLESPDGSVRLYAALHHGRVCPDMGVPACGGPEGARLRPAPLDNRGRF